MVGEEESCDCALVDCNCAQGDGDFARRARLHNPSSITVTLDGSLYIADQFNLRIRKVTCISFFLFGLLIFNIDFINHLQTFVISAILLLELFL